MSSKPNSTIGAKPDVQPNIEAWIGGGALENGPASPADSQQVKQPAKQPAGKTASQPAKQQASRPASQMAEAEVMAMLSVRIPSTLMRKLRIRAVTENQQIQDIIAELLRDYLAEE